MMMQPEDNEGKPDEQDQLGELVPQDSAPPIVSKLEP